jgi:hypothetical protein
MVIADAATAGTRQGRGRLPQMGSARRSASGPADAQSAVTLPAMPAPTGLRRPCCVVVTDTLIAGAAIGAHRGSRSSAAVFAEKSGHRSGRHGRGHRGQWPSSGPGRRGRRRRLRRHPSSGHITGPDRPCTPSLDTAAIGHDATVDRRNGVLSLLGRLLAGTGPPNQDLANIRTDIKLATFKSCQLKEPPTHATNPTPHPTLRSRNTRRISDW